MSAKSDEELYWQKCDAWNEIRFFAANSEQIDKLPYRIQQAIIEAGDLLYKSKGKK